jgi:hypothetical protein
MIFSKNSIAFVTCAFIWTSLCYSMEENLMQQIITWQDVTPLANQIVVVETNSLYFRADDAYQLNSESSTKCGYIASNDTLGLLPDSHRFSLDAVLKKGAPHRLALFEDSQLKDISLSMRLASPEEAFNAHQAIKEGRAKFNYDKMTTGKKALKALKARALLNK